MAGCGTGAFSAAILETGNPDELVGVDTAEAHVAYAQAEIADPRAHFRVGDAMALPFDDGAFDVAVSAYVLNFVLDKPKMVAKMQRVVRPSGTVAVAVWDHANRKEPGRHFWRVTGAADPESYENASRVIGAAITSPDALDGLFDGAGLEDLTTHAINIDAVFEDFDDYWSSNTGFTSALGRYADALSPENRERLMRELREARPIDVDGHIRYKTRAWAIQGTVPV